MFIRKLDFLSPSITLYYKGENSHSSIFSGILTIIVYSICLTFGIFYAIDFFNKTNPQVCYYNRYVEDAGEFPVNSSSMFGFVQMMDTKKNIPDVVDFDLVSIIGLQETVDLYEKDSDLTKINHWLYGPCNNSTDIEGIKELIDFPHFTESACIRKYYDKDTHQYYDTDHNNFIWPEILHGCSHPNRTFYGIIMEKCRNTTLKLLSDGRYCKSTEEIIQYINTRSLNFQLIDQFTDVLNYSTPYRKYFYSISNGLFEDSYTTNHLNFNPTLLISDEGIFFESKKNILSYYFDLNEKITSKSGDSGIYIAFYFWMQNRMQYYERVYEKAQDVLSDVGGLCSIVLTIAELINIIVTYYISLFDTQSYLNEIDNSKHYDKSFFKIKNGIIKVTINNERLCPPKHKTIQLNINQNVNNNESLRKSMISKDETNINDKKNNNNIFRRSKTKKHTNSIKKFSMKQKYMLNNITINNAINNNNDGQSIAFKQNTKNKLKINNESRDEDNIINRNVNKNKVNIEKNKKYIDIDKSNIINNSKYKLKFINYLKYLITLNKCHSYMKYYEYFRIRMISEENLILSNLNIEKILKKEKIEKINDESEKLQL